VNLGGANDVGWGVLECVVFKAFLVARVAQESPLCVSVALKQGNGRSQVTLLYKYFCCLNADK